VIVSEDKITISFTMTRQQAMDYLGQIMSDNSEKCYFAGWLIGLEEELPYACMDILDGMDRAGLGQWGLISVQDAMLMTALANALGHWVDLDNNPYYPKRDGSLPKEQE
jgi:hypothetical protein